MLGSDSSHSTSNNQAIIYNEMRDVLRNELLIVVA
jgi:hypothetical protein